MLVNLDFHARLFWFPFSGETAPKE
jgi:hypothetical protein